MVGQHESHSLNFLRRAMKPTKHMSPTPSSAKVVGSGTTVRFVVMWAKSLALSVNTNPVPSVEVTAPPGAEKLSESLVVPPTGAVRL